MMLVLRRFWIQITADRKRFGILCGMLLLGLLLWGRLIVTSDVPRTAVAKPAQTDDPKPAPGVKAAASSDKPPPRPIRVALARTPVRDPLVINPRHFPKPTSVDILTQDEAKLLGEAAENVREAESRLEEQLQELVDRFKLEAVMRGGPIAVISGRTYQLHDRVPAVGNDQMEFELVEVRRRSVILECEGRRFEVTMDYPGSHQR